MVPGLLVFRKLRIRLLRMVADHVGRGAEVQEYPDAFDERRDQYRKCGYHNFAQNMLERDERVQLLGEVAWLD